MLKKILAATLPFILIFSFSTSGFASITPRYIPYPETSGCRGHVMSGSSVIYHATEPVLKILLIKMSLYINIVMIGMNVLNALTMIWMQRIDMMEV